jgi:hypothetical protein
MFGDCPEVDYHASLPATGRCVRSSQRGLAALGLMFVFLFGLSGLSFGATCLPLQHLGVVRVRFGMVLGARPTEEKQNWLSVFGHYGGPELNTITTSSPVGHWICGFCGTTGSSKPIHLKAPWSPIIRGGTGEILRAVATTVPSPNRKSIPPVMGTGSTVYPAKLSNSRICPAKLATRLSSAPPTTITSPLGAAFLRQLFNASTLRVKAVQGFGHSVAQFRSGVAFPHAMIGRTFQ